MKVRSGVPLPTTCKVPTPGVAPAPGCETFVITSVTPLVVQPGQQVTVTGKNFRPTMAVAATGLAAESQLSLTVKSETQATLVVPEGAAYGPVEYTLSQDGVTQAVTLFSNGGKTDYPIITAAVERICRGEKFYDGAGQLREGTKECAERNSSSAGLPDCTKDGEVDCRATAAQPSVTLAAIEPNKIVAGASVAGVVGTFSGSYDSCSADGAIGCLAVSDFPAVDKNKLVAGNIKTSVTIAGVTGTYPSVATPLASNTAAADLTTFGSGTPVGAYEFFDSAGNVYSATVADNGPITPSTSTQTVSNASSRARHNSSSLHKGLLGSSSS